MDKIDSSPQETAQCSDVVRFLNRTDFQEIASRPEGGLDSLKSMDYASFEDLLTRFNGIARGIPVKEREVDGNGHIKYESEFCGNGIDYIPPRVADRRPLLQRAFESAQSIDDPEKAATMLGLAINVIHPFNDGNGRTGRLTYLLLAHGFDGSEQDSHLFDSAMENISGREIVDLNPEHLRLEYKLARSMVAELGDSYGVDESQIPTRLYGGFGTRDANDYGPASILCSPDIPQESRVKLYEAAEDTMGLPAIFNYVLSSTPDWQDTVKETERNSGALQLDEIFPAMTVEDINVLASTHADMKREYVEKIIDIFVGPQNIQAAEKITDFYRPSRILSF